MSQILEEHPITLILPRSLVSSWAELYEHLGFGSIWVNPLQHIEEEVERVRMSSNLVALEWQRVGVRYPMLQWLQNHEIDCPILLFQNCGSHTNELARAMGYARVIPIGANYYCSEDSEGVVESPFPGVKVFMDIIQDEFLEHCSNRKLIC